MAVWGDPFEAAEEAALLTAAARGDRESFGRIVRGYRERALASAMGLVHNEEDARDLSQEAFVRAWKALDRFHPGRPFYPWFYRILRNVCLNHLERRGRQREVSLEHLVEDESVPFRAPGRGPAEQAERAEVAAITRRAIAALPPRQREILTMYHYDEMGYADIAEALEIPIGTVMSRLFHARRALAEALTPLLDRTAPVNKTPARPVGKKGTDAR
jgi:RNA polymerase sigma-70 factor (ECF subfamily)